MLAFFLINKLKQVESHMPLTRPRASQISNIDFKQSVRSILLTNITLSGGAPATVDGVTLSAGDRVLVAGQTDKSQNGIYEVDIAGTGSNGTWSRASDFDINSDVSAGVIIMVTEGTEYDDTQWKLTTNDPITIGTTDLDFARNAGDAFGQIDIDGNLIVADQVADTLSFEAGNNISISGNTSTKTLLIEVTGISLDSISNGTSDITIGGANGNIVMNVAGTQIAEFNSGEANISGNLNSDNVTVSDTLIVNGEVASPLIPSADDTHSLGNATRRWSNLFLTGNTIQLGNVQIKDTDGALTILESDGVTPARVASAEVTTEEDLFTDGSDFGSITDAATNSVDLGDLTDDVLTEIDLGSLVQAGLLQPDQVVFPSFTVETVPLALPAGQMIFVSDESGGAAIAFSDGQDWRRVTDRNVIS